MIDAMRTALLQPDTVGPQHSGRGVRQEMLLSSGARTRPVLLLAALLAVLCTTPSSAQQTWDYRFDFRLLAQQERQLVQPQEEVIQLPTLQVFVPARLPESPLPLSSIPSAIQVVPGSEIPPSGTPNLQEYLIRLPGITLNDEQGNKAQPDLSIRGFQVTAVTGIPQGVSIFLDGVRINEPTVEEVNFDSSHSTTSSGSRSSAGPWSSMGGTRWGRR
jgi:TonB-dependent receptor-like protein